MEHKLELVHNGQRRFGLLSGEVTLSLDQIAHPFSFRYAEKITATDPISLIRKGDLVSILVDDEPLVEGYVNVSTRRHTVGTLEFEVRGRGAAQDLVDCSVTGKHHHTNATVDKIVGELVKPYGYSVRMAAGTSVGEPLKAFSVDKSEKVMEAIMRACTRRGLWPRALPVGYTIELVRVDATLEQTPLVNGENCTDMEFEEDDTGLYSAYMIHGRTSETDDAYGAATRIRGEVNDPSVGRFRPLRIEARGGDGPSDPGLRAKIERNRRLGQSEIIRCKTSSWRDYDGLLWAPNQLRACVDPEPAMMLDAAEFLISTVKYSWDETLSRGFEASIELKRREAYDPEGAYPVTQAGAAVQ
jgi:prophage tail gpP-like protein